MEFDCPPCTPFVYKRQKGIPDILFKKKKKKKKVEPVLCRFSRSGNRSFRIEDMWTGTDNIDQRDEVDWFCWCAFFCVRFGFRFLFLCHFLFCLDLEKNNRKMAGRAIFTRYKMDSKTSVVRLRRRYCRPYLKNPRDDDTSVGETYWLHFFMSVLQVRWEIFAVWSPPW